MDLSNRVIAERMRAPFWLGSTATDLGFELRHLVRILGDRKAIVFAATSIITLLVLLVAFQLPARYTATTQILIDPRETKFLDVQAIFSGMAPQASQVESQVHVIRSEALMERLVEQLKLEQDPEFNGGLRGANVLRDMGRAVTNLIPQSWRKALGGGSGAFLTSEEEAAVVRNDVVQNVLEHVKVRRNETTLVIDIAMTSASPSKAAKMANTLADLYIVDQLETKFEQTRRATSWLNERLGLLRAELKTSEEAVESFKAEHNLLGSAQGLTLDNQQLAELHKNLVLARTAREEAEVRLQQIQEMNNAGGLNRVGSVVSSDLLTRLREEQVRLVGERSNLASRYQPRHPKMIEVQSELDNVAVKMRDEVRRIIMELENNVAVARARERALESSLGQQSVKSAGQNQIEIQLRQLELEADSNRQIYEAFLQRFKSLTDQDQIQQSDARVISQATVPRYPSFPNKKLIVGGGILVGLMIGVFLALLVERLDNGVKTANQLEQLTGVRNIAVIPAVPEGSGPLAHDYVLKKPLSAYSEAIRALQNAVLLSSSRDPVRSVVVTSSLPDEGKSTVSLSLARLAARSGKRTILVDCDLRRPSIQALLPELAFRNTINDVLEGSATLEQSISIDPSSGLHALAARDGGEQSPDFIASEAMRALMKTLSSRYDFIVIDSPPVLPVGDSLVLSRITEAIVYVARWESTPRDAITTGLQSLADVGATILGTVLSQVDFERYTRYSYGDAGSHYGRYQGYYVE